MMQKAKDIDNNLTYSSFNAVKNEYESLQSEIFNLSNSTQEMFEGAGVPITTIEFESQDKGTNDFELSKIHPVESKLETIIEGQTTQDSIKSISFEKLENLQKSIQLMAKQYFETNEENKKLKDIISKLQNDYKTLQNSSQKLVENKGENENIKIVNNGSLLSQSEGLKDLLIKLSIFIHILILKNNSL